jgi:transcription factor SPEECHLESS
MGEAFLDLFQQSSFNNTFMTRATSPDDLFSILETLEDVSVEAHSFHHFSQSTICSSANITKETMMPKAVYASKKEKIKISKKRKISAIDESLDATQKNSHINVERNRRKQMNEHLSVLRSLIPCFYVKKVSVNYRHLNP